MGPDLSSLRAEYERGGLAEGDLAADPIEQFTRWFDEARASGLVEPNAMLLATVSAQGQPSARGVLLKEYDARGFCFFTNQESRKAADLVASPLCALTFPWFALQRQVRVEGSAVMVPREQSEAYFATRPRASQLGAWASAQSREVADRAELEASYAAAEQRFAGADVPCPPFWGGYVVRPESVEFWQGRRGRMHDRLVYRRDGEAWSISRAAP